MEVRTIRECPIVTFVHLVVSEHIWAERHTNINAAVYCIRTSLVVVARRVFQADRPLGMTIRVWEGNPIVIRRRSTYAKEESEQGDIL
jgi:hypothetical protein